MTFKSCTPYKRMAELLSQGGGGIRVRDEEDLYRVMGEMLSDREALIGRGRLARESVLKNRGALDRVMAHISGLIRSYGEK